MNNLVNTALRSVNPEKISPEFRETVFPMDGYAAGTQQLLVFSEWGDWSKGVFCKWFQ